MDNVVPLPTAAVEPVRQYPRRGRLPNSVARLGDAQCRRYARKEEEKQRAFQRGYEQARQEEQARQKRLLDITARLVAHATQGSLRSLVLAADIAGFREMVLVTAGNADAYKADALSMAARLQHRIAADIEDAEGEQCD